MDETVDSAPSSEKKTWILFSVILTALVVAAAVIFIVTRQDDSDQDEKAAPQSTPSVTPETKPSPSASVYPKLAGKSVEVTSQSSINLTGSLKALATARRIVYTSQNTEGQQIQVSGMIVTPAKRPAQNGNIVAWAHGTTGMADACAPSKFDYSDPTIMQENQAYVALLTGYLKKGWTIAATDYPGLGTPGEHPYLVGASEGKSVLDSVKAARKIDPSLGSNYVIAGHSQGGQAALFAAELAKTYAPELILKGVATFAPLSNFNLVAPFAIGTAGQGFIVMAIYGLAQVDKTVIPAKIFTKEAVAKSVILQNGCLNDILNTYAPFKAEELLIDRSIPQDLLEKLRQYSNPASIPLDVPVFIAQGTKDAIVPLFLTQALQKQECAINTSSTTLTTYKNQTHTGILGAAGEDVLNFVANSFAGKPTKDNCPAS